MASPRDMFMGTPPLGTTSNSINPESLGPLMLGLSVTVIVLTIFSVLIRLYSNYNATRGLGWDDLFCVMGTLLLFLDTAMVLSSISFSTQCISHRVWPGFDSSEMGKSWLWRTRQHCHFVEGEGNDMSAHGRAHANMGLFSLGCLCDLCI